MNNNSDRYICTAEKPWKEEYGDIDPFIRVTHPDAKTVNSSCDCCEAYECPNCGLRFKVELPE